MKKIISILVSLAMLAMSIVCIPAQATSADTTSVDALAAALGATDANLIMSESFDTDGVTPYELTDVTKANIAENSNIVTNGKWVIEAKSAKDVAFKSGITGKSLGDFITSFEFTSTRGWGGSSFYYHSTSGNGNAYNYRLVIKSGAGYASTIILQKKGDTTTEYSECAGPIIYNNNSWLTFNVVLVSKGNIDAAYVWEKGTPMPTTPTVQITTSSKTKGDIYYYGYQDTANIDDIKVYDLTTVSPDNMKLATGLDLNSGNLIYQNDFDATSDVPTKTFGSYSGTSNAIVNKKWQTEGRLGTSTGLTGKKDLKNFAFGFQFAAATNTISGTTYADFAYHSTTGWKNLNDYNRLNMWINGGKFVFVLSAKEGVAKSVTTSYVDGDLINVVMTYIDGTVSAYIWSTGESVPTEPTISVTATTETSGDLYFHLSDATFALDNFFVYDLADTRLYPDHIAAATGIALDEDMLVYESDFDTATEAPAKVFDEYYKETYSGINKIEDGKWVTGGTIGTSTGIAKRPYLKNFAYGFQFTVNNANSGYFATFAYHSTTGWKDMNPENRMQMWENAGKLVFDLYGNDGVEGTNTATARVTTKYAQGDLVNVVMSYVDGKVSAYIWGAGELVPTVPTLTVDSLVASSGDFYYTLALADFAFEDIYVYDITADDADGVYTTMESSYQLESTFKGLPKTIETTIKMPTIFTGGAGNTIIGNHKYENYVFSFEINANGNPYVAFDPPWKQRRVIEFTDVDVRTGEWLNLAITTDIVADTVSCYVNGELKQTLAIPTHYDPVLEQNTDFLDYDIGSEMYVGRDMRGAYDKYYFKGKIKTLTMFSDIRTAEEIAADMNGVAADADALIADYCFDGCYGKNVTDRSANSLDLLNVGYMEEAPEEPTDYAYSFAVVGDTQILTRVYPEKLSSIYDWIVENKEAHNIQYVMGLGDITDSDTDKEWQTASAEISKLNGVVPYSLVRGNHDSEAKFSRYLTDIYSSQIDGSYNNDINSSYKIFTVGEVDYLLINLNMGAIDEELAWAENLIATHPNHNVIITTHIYLDNDGTRIDDYGTVPATTCRTNANNGDDMWNELISKYSNISLVMSGHVSSTEVLVTKSEGANGNIVTEMLIDPQSIDESYSAGPAGLVTMLYFSEDGKDVQVRYYSTVNGKYYGQQNQFSMTLDTVDYLYGDINDDTEINVVDFIRLKKAVAKMDVAYNSRTANINKDETIDALDLTELKKLLLNKAS